MFASKVLNLLIAVLLLVSANANEDAKVADLLAMQSKSKNGIINLDRRTFNSFVTKKLRTYTSVILFTSNRVAASRPQLLLDKAIDELSLAAQAYYKSSEGRGKVFFFVCSVEDNEEAFRKFNIQSVPVLLQIPPSEKALSMPVADRTPYEAKIRYPWTAEQLVNWLSELGLPIATVKRPSIFSDPKLVSFLAAVLVVYSYILYKLFQSGFIFKPIAWSLISLLIFWFSVSGGMYNIIRGVPLFEINEHGLPRFFPKEMGKSYSGMEGYIVGATYLLFSGSLSILLYGIPTLKSKVLRTAGSVFFIVLSLYAVFNIFDYWRNKTGYRLVSYL
uniref:Uncharacterized protein n=1 Tax=Polytomella parva TaxID=51329 RepID=A0A7S0YS80_9CHLO|mmetsp:Transcript_7274/g.14362  ORF Transcript_7274/g.14362 Transcript_7274/m.14362 type:complete len:332 (+) Transcript_7274:78-1073(+)|eukprot:CAMPEP_0175064480 /NCGR_PEP_ID=MMETSP0052_2-20121109/15356_1 /TAXON_ID=51329 ORGANISM="Polytomella parva, Strain SAG 63-3" /NCGR_SAMPLE_ID=MMETSP0052_2 /ASSEMBLY_ACC=CAM_ASM_000194 /LENGTH=331 /DNA_ID=CAMNT_0016330835 /DNA_START=64 /DNA_END=1059 /DNA_ORIENTATION=+